MNQDTTNYYRSNPFFRILIGTGRFKILRFMIILVAWYAILFGVCWYDDALILLGDEVGLLEDVVMYTLCPILVIALALTLRLLSSVESLLKCLPEMVEPDADVRSDMQHIRDTIGLRTSKSRWWYAACLCFMTLLVYILQVHMPLFMHEGTTSWARLPETHVWAYIVGVPWALFWTVVVGGNLLWFIVCTAWTVLFSQLFDYVKQNRLTVMPLAPDGKGGLSPIGEVSFSLTLVMSCGTLFVIAWIILFGIDLSLLFGSCVYLVILVALFFLPLLSVHHAMKEAKQQEVERLSVLFRSEYAGLPDIDKCGNTSRDEEQRRRVKDSMEYLGRLEQLYRRVETMPVWPFDFRTLARFISVIVIPLVLFIIQLATQDVLTKLIDRTSD